MGERENVLEKKRNSLQQEEKENLKEKTLLT